MKPKPAIDNGIMWAGVWVAAFLSLTLFLLMPMVLMYMGYGFGF